MVLKCVPCHTPQRGRCVVHGPAVRFWGAPPALRSLLAPGSRLGAATHFSGSSPALDGLTTPCQCCSALRELARGEGSQWWQNPRARADLPVPPRTPRAAVWTRADAPALDCQRFCLREAPVGLRDAWRRQDEATDHCALCVPPPRTETCRFSGLKIYPGKVCLSPLDKVALWPGR